MMSPLFFSRRTSMGMPRGTARRGFSIVELMIAIGIATFLMAGILVIVGGVRQTSRTQGNLSDLHESERFLMTVLDSSVHQAGYFTDPLTNTLASGLPVPATPNPDGSTFTAGQFINGVDGTSDTFNLRFQAGPGDGLMNCQGDTNTTAVPITWTSSFKVNANYQLVCQVATNGGAPGAEVALADNVSKVSVVYGVDTDSDGTVDRYFNATDVATTNNWPNVYTMKLNVTFRETVSKNTAQDMGAPIYHLISFMNKP